MKHPLTKISIVITLLALTFSALGVTPAQAAGPFVVTKTADTNDGACNGDCSLREAIIAANAAAGDDTITVPAGTYTLTITGTDEDAAATGDLDITSNIIINGAGLASTIIQAGTLGVGGPPDGIDRVFEVIGTTVNISGVTIRNGDIDVGIIGGGGIYNTGTLTITDSTLSGNTDYNGGGIANDGTLTITDSTLSGNTGIQGGGIYNNTGTATITNSTLSSNTASYGGGIYNNTGTLTITDSMLSSNIADDGGGGGIYNGSTLTITNSTLSANSATSGSDGGGIENTGTLTITDSILGSNSADSAGGIFNVGMLTITGSTISDNSAVFGGGIGNGGPLTITDSTLSGNSADDSGGGIWNDSNTVTITHSILASNSAVYGGGIFNQFAPLTITNSTLSGNSADNSGGGLYNDGGTLTVKNSTLSGNSAVFGGGVSNGASTGTITITNSTLTSNTATGNGGGIYDEFDTLTIKNSTLSANSAASGGGIYNGNGGGTLNYANTIIANSTAGGDCKNFGSIATNTNNLVEDGTCAAALSGDPKLGPLASNGGLTQTMALLDGSKAIDAGSDNVCAAAPVSNKDQRGVTRPIGAHCDIGSYETDATPPSSALTLYSIGAQDGQIIESFENSNQGGLPNASSATFHVGDDTQRKQIRGLLSFNTGASLPDNAIITKMTLKFKQQAIVGGGNPVVTFQGFLLDVKRGVYGTTALEASDFQTAGTAVATGPFKPAPLDDWYSIDITFARDWINKLATNGGLTQIRLHFKLDDNNNAIANYLSLYSGDAELANRPQLVITYH